MKLLDQLERKFGRYYIPNLTIVLAFGQTALYILALMQTIRLDLLTLVPALVPQEPWRLITFAFVPVLKNPLCFAFGVYLFILMGGALESHWGEFRYNLFLLIGYVATVAASFAASFVTPYHMASNVFIYGSVFLAFAFFNPDFIIQLFFVLPIAIKWLALATWIGYGLSLIFGGWETRLQVLAAVGNFLIFFGSDLAWRIRSGGRQMRWQAKQASRRRESEPFHRCTVCGATDQSHPAMLFRYCKSCEGNLGYCEEHFLSHTHVTSPVESGE